MRKFVWLHCFLSHYSQASVMYTHTQHTLSLSHIHTPMQSPAPPHEFPSHHLLVYDSVMYDMTLSYGTWLIHIGHASFIRDIHTGNAVPISLNYCQVPLQSLYQVCKPLYICTYIRGKKRERLRERDCSYYKADWWFEIAFEETPHQMHGSCHTYICVCVPFHHVCVCCRFVLAQKRCTSDVCPNDVHHAYTHIHTHTHTYPLSHTCIHTHIHTNTHDMHQAPVHKKCWYMI